MKSTTLRLSSFSVTAAVLAGVVAATLVPISRGQPPAWPDTQIVPNGCYVSTAVYLARLRAEYPAVVARAATVRLPSGQWHTIAVIWWEERPYLRDMYIGVAPAPGDVQQSFDGAISDWRAKGGRHDYRDRAVTSVAERCAEVAAASHLLTAERTEIISVLSDRGPIPVLAWKTAEGKLALYEPSTGTAVGSTNRSPIEVAQELYGPGGRIAKISSKKATVQLE